MPSRLREFRDAIPKGLRILAPYAADVGTVAFAATTTLTMIALAAEFFRPGFAVNFIAPQAVIAAAVVFGGLSLVSPSQPRRTLRQHVSYAVVGTAVSVFAYWAAWWYFASVPEFRFRYAAGIAGTVCMMFAAYSNGAKEADETREVQ